MTSNDNTEPACLTMTGLMKRWRCSRQVILKAIDRGDLQVFRIGNRSYRVTLAEVERYEKKAAKAA